jgi:hypothetical protein
VEEEIQKKESEAEMSESIVYKWGKRKTLIENVLYTVNNIDENNRVHRLEYGKNYNR